MGEQKVTRKNHPLLVKARQEGYQQGYRAGRKKVYPDPIIVEARKKAYDAGKVDGYQEGFEEGFEEGRRSLDNYINTLHRWNGRLV